MKIPLLNRCVCRNRRKRRKPACRANFMIMERPGGLRHASDGDICQTAPCRGLGTPWIMDVVENSLLCARSRTPCGSWWSRSCPGSPPAGRAVGPPRSRTARCSPSFHAWTRAGVWSRLHQTILDDWSVIVDAASSRQKGISDQFKPGRPRQKKERRSTVDWRRPASNCQAARTQGELVPVLRTVIPVG